jgi:hypothetical protein
VPVPVKVVVVPVAVVVLVVLVGEPDVVEEDTFGEYLIPVLGQEPTAGASFGIQIPSITEPIGYQNKFT